MKLKGRSIFAYFLLVITQIFISALLYTGPYVMISILPALILIMPTDYGTIRLMIIAFLTGLLVDITADGVPGLNVLALVPVAYLRRGFLTLICGEELFARGDDLHLNKQGIIKTSALILFCQAAYFLIYIFADSAGTRSLEFNIIRFAVSMGVSYVASLFICSTLTSDRD